MTESELRARVTSEIAAALRVDAEHIAPESFLIGDLGAESIDLVDLTFRLEKAFGIEIPEGELFEGTDPAPENLRIRDVVQYLLVRLN